MTERAADVMVSSTGKVWEAEPCHRCGGHGVVAVYSMNDFEGADFCPVCGGSGRVWRTGKVVAVYPGGPFC